MPFRCTLNPKPYSLNPEGGSGFSGFWVYGGLRVKAVRARRSGLSG